MGKGFACLHRCLYGFRKKLFNSFKIGPMASTSLFTTGYMVTYKGAKKILKEMMPIKQPVDLITGNIKLSHNVYGITPPPINSSKDFGSHTLGIANLRLFEEQKKNKPHVIWPQKLFLSMPTNIKGRQGSRLKKWLLFFKAALILLYNILIIPFVWGLKLIWYVFSLNPLSERLKIKGKFKWHLLKWSYYYLHIYCPLRYPPIKRKN